MRWRFVPAASAVMLLAFVAACGEGRKVDDQRVDLPPPPANGLQLVLPEMDVPPGTDTMMCWFTTLQTTEEVWVRAYEVFQGAGGHHLVGFITVENAPDGKVEDCTEASSMTYWRPLLTGTSVDGFDLPDGYAVKVPAGAQLVFQTHYVNAGDTPVRIRDVVNLHFLDDTAGVTPVGPYVSTTIDFAVPPTGQPYTATYECDVPQDVNGFFLFGHMHEWGTRMSIAAGPAGGLETLYEVDPWTPEYRDVAPSRAWPMDDPLVLHAGDKLQVSCTWINDGSATLGFPNEMCASLLWVYPTEDPLVCTASPT